jgi:hypothetical protein
VATTIGSANIQLSADAAGLGQDLAAAKQSIDKFADASNRSLGKLGELGERFTSALGRADALGSSLTRLSEATTDKLAAAFDVARTSLASLVGAMMIARSAGASMMSGIGIGVAGIAASLGIAALSRPGVTGAGADFLRSRGLGGRLATAADVEHVEAGRGGAEASRVRSRAAGTLMAGDIGASAGERAARFREEADAVGRTAEEMERLRIEREKAKNRTLLEAGIITRDVYEATSRSLREASSALEGLTEARRRDREAAMAAADAELRRTAHVASWTADMARGRAVTDSLMTPRERAVAELRELEELRSRRPDAISEDAIRRRAGVLASGLSEAGPIGAAAMGIGESATISAINAAGRRAGPSAEDLLTEVRDELGRIRDAIATATTPIASSIVGIAGLLGRP